jgi:hypothetical protein
MDYISSFYIFHIKDVFLKYLRAYLLILFDVDYFIYDFFALGVSKIQNPVIKSTFFKHSECILDPQIRCLVGPILVNLRLVE